MKSHEFIVEAALEEMTDVQRQRMSMLKGKAAGKPQTAPTVKSKPNGPASQSTVAAEDADKNPHTSALGKALHRDLSKEKHASPVQKEKNKERWAKNPHNPDNKTVSESDGGASCSSAIAAGPVPSLFKAPVKRVKETVSQSPVPKQKKARN